LKQYKGRESIPVSDVACVVQSVHTVEQDNESDAVLDNFVLCNSDVLHNLEKKLCHLSLPQREKMARVIMKFTEIFSDVPGRANCVLHDVNVGNSEPIKQNPYRVNPRKLEFLKKEVNYLLEHGIKNRVRATGAHHASWFQRVMDLITFVQIIGRRTQSPSQTHTQYPGLKIALTESAVLSM